jgi:hypothetical protein
MTIFDFNSSAAVNEHQLKVHPGYNIGLYLMDPVVYVIPGI